MKKLYPWLFSIAFALTLISAPGTMNAWWRHHHHGYYTHYYYYYPYHHRCYLVPGHYNKKGYWIPKHWVCRY